MAREPAEQRRRAHKYGRRQAVLRASHSAKELTAIAQRMLADLAAAGAPASEVRELTRALAQATDVTRRRAAVWAIVDALEALEAKRT